MTLILTELSKRGVTMAADSAVTHTNTSSGFKSVCPNATIKLQKIPYLKAGISCWGMGTIESESTDEWLLGFIEKNNNLTTLQSFAEKLAGQLNEQVPKNISGEGRLGFHLATFEMYNGERIPSFYHIHDGRSEVLETRDIEITPNRFNANHDMPPKEFTRLISKGREYITRNGDYYMYVEIFEKLKELFCKYKKMGIQIPHSQNLADRAEYLIFQIRTVSEIYRLSNLIPGIGGGIHYLTINPDGIQGEGIKYL